MAKRGINQFETTKEPGVEFTTMKLGFSAALDRQMNSDLRFRLTGSMYKTNKELSNTLYGGDRAGSRCYWVLENTAATESAQFTSGLIKSRIPQQGNGSTRS